VIAIEAIPSQPLKASPPPRVTYFRMPALWARSASGGGIASHGSKSSAIFATGIRLSAVRRSFADAANRSEATSLTLIKI